MLDALVQFASLASLTNVKRNCHWVLFSDKLLLSALVSVFVREKSNKKGALQHWDYVKLLNFK